MDLDLFTMERYQSLYWHQVEYDLSESGVLPLSIQELVGAEADRAQLLHTKLGYPLSEGSDETRANIAAWYPGASNDEVTVVNGGSEANFLTLLALLDPGDRLAFMVPNYLQGSGLGRALGRGTDTFGLTLQEGRWALDVAQLEAAVGAATKVVMVCNPNNPTGSVLSPGEMDEIVRVAERNGSWIVADEIYRGAELEGQATTPTFWDRYDRVVVTSGLSKAFAMPGLRVGWVVAPRAAIRRIWERHDYTTLTPGMLSDRLAAVAMSDGVRDRILARTKSIVRANYPRLEQWLFGHADVLEWAAPAAGAIAYAQTALPGGTEQLVERVRTEQSVLLVPGEMFGLAQGIRFGFGYDIEHTLEGLARVDEVLADVRAVR
jgi:aspartate/methionine/tyrosine aminotransferase